MDDTNQNTQQANVAPQAQDQPQASVGGSVVQQPVVTPVSAPQKEQQPPASSVSEFVKPSEAEPAIHPELAEVGVEKVSEVPELTLEDKKAGLAPAKESVPVLTQPSGLIQLPMTEEEARRTIKTTNVSDSRHWLAVLVEKMFQILKYGSSK
ncbi:MAG: hypothetical protein HYU49_01805 [Candidatus Levybacteria bacterium]|nr:hypothetical protein [Candidatus Levybacteria bacterium]MBI2190254.1 hypothetical protein [Candidatus Levybacteria bacterium]